MPSAIVTPLRGSDAFSGNVVSMQAAREKRNCITSQKDLGCVTTGRLYRFALSTTEEGRDYMAWDQRASFAYTVLLATANMACWFGFWRTWLKHEKSG